MSKSKSAAHQTLEINQDGNNHDNFTQETFQSSSQTDEKNPQTEQLIFSLSKAPKNVSLVDSWSSFHHGDGTYHRKNTKSWKYVVVLALILLFMTLMVWECIAYIQLKGDLDATVKNVQLLTLELHSVKYNIPTGIPQPQKLVAPKNTFALINLCGENDQTEISKREQVFNDWKPTIIKGDISYYAGYIKIEVPGIYYVYAQMFFFMNNNKPNETMLHFYIKKNRSERLAVATVPYSTCKTLCTRYVSRIVELKKGDHLTVTTYSDGIQFKMSKDKTHFGAYLVKFLDEKKR